MARHSSSERPELEIFTREDFERAWQPSPPAHKHSGSETAILVYRNSPHDFEQHLIQLWIDDAAVGEICFGQVFSRRVDPGPHTVRASNALFTETLDVEARSDERVHVRCGRGFERARWLKRLFPFIASLRVWLARV